MNANDITTIPTAGDVIATAPAEAPQEFQSPGWVGPRGDVDIDMASRAFFTFVAVYFPMAGITITAGFFLEARDVGGAGGMAFFSSIGLSAVMTFVLSRWRRYRFRSTTVGTVAVELANNGLFRGKEGWKRARVLHKYDKRAHELNRVIFQITRAEKDLEASDAPEPRLLDELAARKTALEAEREVVFAQARDHFRVELTHAAAARAARETSHRNDSATTDALNALAAARRATYQPGITQEQP